MNIINHPSFQTKNTKNLDEGRFSSKNTTTEKYELKLKLTRDESDGGKRVHLRISCESVCQSSGK